MSFLEIQKCCCRFEGNPVSNDKWSEPVRAVLRSQGLGVNSSQGAPPAPISTGSSELGEGRSSGLQFEWLSCTIRYRGLGVMPAGLTLLCLLPCSWIPSSSYLKNTWAAHNFRLSHSSEAIGTTWLFKALSCLPCLAELGYMQSSFVHSKLMSSFKEILFPARSAARDPPAFWSECGTMALVKIGQLLACVLREMLAMFGIEDCVMGGLNQHLSAEFTAGLSTCKALQQSWMGVNKTPPAVPTHLETGTVYSCPSVLC